MGAANLLRVFGVPAVLAIASAIGLLSGLFGDGFWDWLSWVALGAPVAVIARVLAVPRTLKLTARIDL